MDKQCGFKLLILNSLKISLLKASREKYNILSYLWIPVLTFSLIEVLCRPISAYLALYPFLPKAITEAEDSYFFHQYFIFLYEQTLHSIVYAFLAVGLFRYLILREGTSSEYVWWNIIFSRRVAYVFLTAMFLSCVELTFEKTVLLNVYDLSDVMGYFYVPVIQQFIIAGLLAAIFAFVFPMLSIAENITFRGLIEAVCSVKNNIIKIYIIQLIIFLPSYILLPVLFDISKGIEDIFGYNIALSVSANFLQNMIYYAFVSINIVFVGVLYKSLRDSGKFVEN